MKKPLKRVQPLEAVTSILNTNLTIQKARPNRFAGRSRVQPVVVLLAPDEAKVFQGEESVNAVLR